MKSGKLFVEVRRGRQSSFPGRVVELPDGTTVKFRLFSKSGGSTIEVYYPGRAGPVKVHIE